MRAARFVTGSRAKGLRKLSAGTSERGLCGMLKQTNTQNSGDNIYCNFQVIGRYFAGLVL